MFGINLKKYLMIIFGLFVVLVASFFLYHNKELYINSDTVSFREEVKELTEGKGADVIYDPVGGDVFDESIRCINWGGRILIIGFTSGRIPTAPVNMPLIKGFSIIGVRAGEYGRRDPVKGKENITAVKKLADEGNLKPHICKTFKLKEAKEAIHFLSERKLVGKVAIVME